MILGKLMTQKKPLSLGGSIRLFLCDVKAGGDGFYSDDFGQNWHTVQNAYSSYYIQALDYADTGELYIVTSHQTPKILKSSNYLTSSAYLTATHAQTKNTNGTVAVTSDGTSVYAFGEADSPSHLKCSKDSGKTWSEFSVVSGQYNNTGVCCSRTTGQYVYVANGHSVYGLYRSTNYGSSFTKLYPSTCANPRAYHPDCSDDGQYVLCSRRDYPAQIWKSNDYGASWSYITMGVTPTTHGYCAVSTDGKYQYVLARNYLFYSTDYGANWSYSLLSMTGSGYLASPKTFVSRDGSKLFMGEYNSLHAIYSSDYGQTWSSITLPSSIVTGSRTAAIIKM